MTNQELKKQQSEKILEKYKHLTDVCKISFSGIEDDNIYFHPLFTINENVYITGQSDTNDRFGIYALRVNIKEGDEFFTTEIDASLLDNIVFGCINNMDNVLIALKTMSRIRTHINQLQGLLQEYITNLILKNSVKDTSDSIINELKITTALVDFKNK